MTWKCNEQEVLDVARNDLLVAIHLVNEFNKAIVMSTAHHSALYRHYKGGKYLLLVVAETHEHNGDLDVVYVSLTTGKTVTRPYEQDSRKQDSWTDMVTWPDGAKRARFAKEIVGFDYSYLFGEKVIHELKLQK